MSEIQILEIQDLVIDMESGLKKKDEEEEDGEVSTQRCSRCAPGCCR
jgi:hypothetical protein